MTGQVKEEVITRFRELGICVEASAVEFMPRLLREREFVAEPSITITRDDGTRQTLPGLVLPAEQSNEIFMRSGVIRRLDLVFGRSELFFE